MEKTLKETLHVTKTRALWAIAGGMIMGVILLFLVKMEWRLALALAIAYCCGTLWIEPFYEHKKELLKNRKNRMTKAKYRLRHTALYLVALAMAFGVFFILLGLLEFFPH